MERIKTNQQFAIFILYYLILRLTNYEMIANNYEQLYYNLAMLTISFTTIWKQW